ncbi:MAG: hypothetical protein ACJ0BB_00905 [Dehalococcoidia bacterium]
MVDWHKAIEQTYVVKFPQQHLATFGVTNLDYFIVTEPIYTAFDSSKNQLEGVLRTGTVKANQPHVITPNYALNISGFSKSAYEYMESVSSQYGPNSPGIMYQYSNHPDNLEIVGGIPTEIAQRISEDLTEKNHHLSVVIVGVDEFWDVALLKFIYEYTASSISFNSQEMMSAGLLDPVEKYGSLPAAVVSQIEEMFKSVQIGGSAHVLKQELDRWGVYNFYEDRFLGLFK